MSDQQTPIPQVETEETQEEILETEETPFAEAADAVENAAAAEEYVPADDEELEDEHDVPEDDTVTFKRSHLYMALIPLAFIVGLSVGYIFWGRTVTPDIGAAQTAGAAVAQAPAEAENGSADSAAEPQNPAADSPASNNENPDVIRYDVPIDDDPIIGAEDATITIVEFSDYECPYCQKWRYEVFDQILQNYPDDVRIVFRDFPLASIHPNATGAAQAAQCANDQDKYWEYHDKLFSGEHGFGGDAFRQYAQDLELNMQAFNACLQDKKYADEVQADFEFAANLGVRSTPTFFINGIAVVGAQPYEVFEQVIEKELAGEIP